MTENSPNLGRESDIWLQETRRVLNHMNSKRTTPRYTVIKMVKVKGRVLKAAKEKLVKYKENPTRLSADFSTETFQVRNERPDTFKVLKGRISQPRIL